MIASEFFVRNSFAIKKLRDEYNVNFKKYSKDLLKKLKNKSDEVTRNLAEQDPDGKKILENILKYERCLCSGLIIQKKLSGVKTITLMEAK